MDQLRGLLQQYVGGGSGDGSSNVHDDFDQVAQQAPQGALASGIANAFQSDQTPPFGQMVGQMFDGSGGQQKAGLLNSIMSAAGPGVVNQVLGSVGLSSLAGMLGGGGQVTPDQADQVPTDAVQQLASHAQNQDSSIVDTISQYAAGNPGMVKSLGSTALGMIMSHIGQL